MRARPISCCFSGHRPAKLPWGEDEDDPRCRALKARLRDALDAAYEAGRSEEHTSELQSPR